MPDDKKKKGQPDAIRINPNEDYEVSESSKKLGGTPNELKKAIRKACSHPLRNNATTIALADKCNAFARDVVGEWKDSKNWNAQGYQMRYLYSNAYRSAHTAFAFWKLHAIGAYHECHILARVLLERIVNGRIATMSPERALRLMVTELGKEIKGIKSWKDLQKLNDATINNWLAEHAAKCNELLKLLNLAEPPRWNFFKLIAEVKLEPLYRTAYRDLSQYTHASFSVSAPGCGDEDCRMMKFVALLQWTRPHRFDPLGAGGP